MSKHWWDYYMNEAEEPVAGQAPTVGGMGTGESPDSATGDSAKNKDNATDNMQQNQDNSMLGSPDDSPEDKEDKQQGDPKKPELPEDKENQGFEEWRNEFFKLAIKSDSQEMIDVCKKMREKDDLDASQRKFIEDNLQIQWLRQDANIDKISKSVRKLIKGQLDKNYPSTSLMQHIVKSLDEMPQLNEVFYKLSAFYGMKGDLHRKFICAMIGAVQIGGGGSREDLVYNEKDYSINISTRMSTEWGEISLGKWSLQVDDPERYLEEPELARLKDGAPEEKTVLRHRIILSSISERFKTRAFLINVVDAKGNIHFLAWDLGDSIMSSYQEGKLVVRTRLSDASEALLDDDGNITPLTDLVVKYVKQSNKRDDNGVPYKYEKNFIERRNGMLYFVGNEEVISDMTNMQGVFFKKVPYSGNPSDLKTLQRNIPSLNELLMRKS